jgi:predicted HicB family RNase H-like nuclease
LNEDRCINLIDRRIECKSIELVSWRKRHLKQFGHIAGIKDIIGFHADSVNELKQAFYEAVDDYLATCEKLGRAPQKPYSGKLMLRIPPEVHAHAAMMAEAHGKSLNQWAADILMYAN